MNSISDILSSSGSATPPIYPTPASSIGTSNPLVSNPTPRLIINTPVSSSITTPSSSFLTINNNNNNNPNSNSNHSNSSPLSSLAMLSSTPSFTVLTPGTVKEEAVRPPSPKRPTLNSNASTSTSLQSNKRSISSSSASKSPAISSSPASTSSSAKKKRLTMTNNVQPISPTIRSSHQTDSTASGQNKRPASVDDTIFFEKVQKTLRSPLVFDNFLRCILLYVKRIISRHELFELIQSYLR